MTTEPRECPHELYDKESACADGMCPFCLAAKCDALETQLTQQKAEYAKQLLGINAMLKMAEDREHFRDIQLDQQKALIGELTRELMNHHEWLPFGPEHERMMRHSENCRACSLLEKARSMGLGEK